MKKVHLLQPTLVAIKRVYTYVRRLNYREFLKQTDTGVSITRRLITNISVIILLPLAVVFVVQKLSTEQVILREFSVSAELKARGVDETAVSHRLADQLNRHLQPRVAGYRLQCLHDVPAIFIQQGLSVQVLGSQISLDYLVLQARDWMGLGGIVITGDLVTDDDSVTIRIRLEDSGRNLYKLTQCSGVVTDMDPLFGKVAEFILEQLEPYLFCHYLLHHDPDRANELIERNLYRDRASKEKLFTYLKAQIHQLGGDYREAGRLFELVALRSEDPNLRALGHIGYGQCLIALGRPPEAIDQFQKANDIDETSGGYEDMAITLRELGQCDSAIIMASKAVKLNSVTSAPLITWALCLICQADTAGGMDKFHEAQQRFPNDPVTQWRWGEMLGVLGKTAEALQQYERAFLLYSSFTDPYSGACQCLIELGYPSKAREYCEKAIRYDTRGTVSEKAKYLLRRIQAQE